MKKLTMFSALFIGAMTLAQGIKFEDTNFSSIMAKAKKENKLIFVDAYTSWCGPCKLMVKNVFPQKAVGDYYNSNFVNAKIDMEKGEGIALSKKYNVKVFPTYLFIDGNGEVVHRRLGYVEEKDFIQFAKDANDPAKRLGTLKQKFEAGEKDPEFLKKLARLTVHNDEEFAAKVTERYFNGKTDLDKDDVEMLLSLTEDTDTDSPLYKIFQAKKSEITKILPAESYEAIDKDIKLNTIIEKSYNAETKKWNDQYFMTETQKFITKDEAVKIKAKVKATIALRDKDIPTYEKLIIDLYRDPSAVSSEELNFIAWKFFENVTNKESLQKAVTWAQESVKKDQNFANTDTLANLYNKIGDKKNARIWAEKSIELAKSTGQDSADMEKLLNSL